MAEILKTVVAICNTGGFERLLVEWSQAGKLAAVQASHVAPTPSQLETFQEFLTFFGQFCNRGNYFSRLGFVVLRSLVIKYTIPFLRKVVILLHVRYGTIFSDTGFDAIHLPEHIRLAKALQLPTFEEMLSSTLRVNNDDDKRLRLLISTWAMQVKYQKQTFSLPHPTIFELVGLPLRYDTLVDVAMRRRCPNSGKELADPSVCLFCGEIFCSQAVCCSNQGKGGCNQHFEK
jgi:E3 ubiquitin-protein ligase UBR1